METYNNFKEDGKIKKYFKSRIAFLFFSLAFSLFVLYVFVVPEYEKMKINELEIGIKRDGVEMSRNMIQNIIDFSEKNRKIDEEEMGKIQSLTATEDNLEKYLANIDDLAKSKGMIIKSFSFERAKSDVSKETSGLARMNIGFSVSGNFLDLMEFLKSIEQGIPLLDVESLSLIKTKQEVSSETGEKPEEENIAKQNPTLTYNVTISTYYFK